MTATTGTTTGPARAVPGLGTLRPSPSCAVAGATGRTTVLDAVRDREGEDGVLAVTVGDGTRVLELPAPSQHAVRTCFGPAGSAAPDAPDLDGATVRALRTLVLDGVLELDDERSPRSGPATWSRLCARPADRGGSRLHRLSVDAVRHGQSFGLVDPGHLTARLYFFHRRPASPAWRYRLPTIATVQEFLQLDRTMATGRMRASWRASTRNDPRASGWMFYRSTARSRGGDSPRYKVYVSPAIEQVPAVVAELPDLLDGDAVEAFKVGAHLYTLLRPDKLVLYCSSLDAVRAAGRRVGAVLGGVDAHGVPFTAPLSDDGLVSWGVDPPARYHAGSNRERNSWRLWACSLLADALVAAAEWPATGLAPWEYALLRLREEGVALPGWEPPAGFAGPGTA